MENKKINKTKPDDTVNKAGQAEPIRNLSDANEFIREKENVTIDSNKKNIIRKNLQIGIALIGLILVLIGGVQFFNSKETVLPTPQKTKTGNEFLPENNSSLTENTLTPEKNNTSFPPVYKEENISRPGGIVQPEKKEISILPEKLISSTEEAATITFNKDGKKIKLVLFFKEVKELYIDGEKIDPSLFINYTGIIKEGKALENTGRQEKIETESLNDLDREQKRQNEIVSNTIIKVMAKDGLITSGQPFEFRLMWNKLYINGKSQPKEQYEKYRTLYEETSGKRLTEKSNVHISQ